jgi:hypothetical protein
MSSVTVLIPNIDFCPYYSEVWIKKPEYYKYWKCSKSLSSVIVTISRESDNTRDVLINITAVVTKAVKEGHF